MSAFTDSVRHEPAQGVAVHFAIGGPRTVAAREPAWVCRGSEFSWPPGCQLGSDEMLQIGSSGTERCARCQRPMQSVFAKVAITRGSLEPGHALPSFLVRPEAAGLTIRDWIPEHAPGRESFLTVDRWVDVIRYSGFKFKSTGVPWVEAIRWGMRQMHTAGANPDTVWVNEPNDVRQMLPEVIECNYGPVKVKTSEEIRDGEMFFVTTDTWMVLSWPGADVLVCSAPGYNAHMAVDKFYRELS